MSDRIDLTKEEFQKVLKRKVGHGTDGVVFKYNDDYLIKIYRKNFFEKPEEIINNNDEDIKIYDPKNKPSFKSIKPNIRYYKDDEEGKIRLTDEDAISEIISKQKNINDTELPKKLVYVNGKFVGVLLKRSRGVQLHSLSGLPFLYKKKLALKIIKAVKELLDNNVYHNDLSNSPFVTTTYVQGDKIVATRGHSHVLVNLRTGDVNIIDLDGKSTVYSDSIDSFAKEATLENLKTLLLEFLYGVDEEVCKSEGDYYIEELNRKAVVDKLENKGIKKDVAEKIATEGFTSIEEAEEIVKNSKESNLTTLDNLLTFLLNFLYNADEECKNDNKSFNKKEVIDKLKNRGIKKDIAKKIATEGFTSIEEAEDIVKRSR